MKPPVQHFRSKLPFHTWRKMCNLSKLILLVAVAPGVKGTAKWLFLFSLPEICTSDHAFSVPLVLLPGSWRSLRFFSPL